MMMTMMVLS